MSQVNFVPVLLGSDINVYGMARSFHERYGIVSHALASFPLVTTRDSDIIDLTIVNDFQQDQIFLDTLTEFAAAHGSDGKRLLLVACSDTYAALASKHRDQLSEHYEVPYIDYDLLSALTDKATFYRMCAERGIDHPATVVVSSQEHQAGKEPELDFGFPVALKPSNSVEYLSCDFPGRKKAYVLDTPEQLTETVRRIFASGYRSDLIVQEFIPGDDSHMRVLNAYVGRDGQVQMMCFGHPLLEDYLPATIGNYTAIMSEPNQQVYDQIQTFLESLDYTGFANFDMKYDDRDGKYKLFELNPRQGRSSFYVTLAGYNLAEYLVEDCINGRKIETIYADNEVLWLGVPKSVLFKYAAEGELLEKAKRLIRQGRWGTTLFYRADRNLKRGYRIRKMFIAYHLRYRKYFGKRSLES